jgi:N6-L-threonylcarbamoyladenine synthase
MYRLDGPTRISRLGSTIDDAVGEAYDKAAAILGLGYPGGPIVDRRAQRGDDRAHEFPVSRLGTGSLDFSFSGLKTALLYAARGTPTADGSGSPRYERDAAELSDAQIDDLCASFQRAAVRALRIKLERALDSGRFDGPPRCLVIGGGVAANSRLRAEVESLAHERGLAVRIPAMEHCLDNAAMIAGLGCALAADRAYADLTLHARPRS